MYELFLRGFALSRADPTPVAPKALSSKTDSSGSRRMEAVRTSKSGFCSRIERSRAGPGSGRSLAILVTDDSRMLGSSEGIKLSWYRFVRER